MCAERPALLVSKDSEQKISVKRSTAQELSEREFRQCRALSMWPHGSLGHKLERERVTMGKPGTVYQIRDHHGKLLAWSLLYQDYWGEGLRKWMCELWVHEDYRRRGYGTKLIRLAKRQVGPVVVYPHDKASVDFFNAPAIQRRTICNDVFIHYTPLGERNRRQRRLSRRTG